MQEVLSEPPPDLGVPRGRSRKPEALAETFLAECLFLPESRRSKRKLYFCRLRKHACPTRGRKFRSRQKILVAASTYRFGNPLACGEQESDSRDRPPPYPAPADTPELIQGPIARTATLPILARVPVWGVTPKVSEIDRVGASTSRIEKFGSRPATQATRCFGGSPALGAEANSTRYVLRRADYRTFTPTALSLARRQFLAVRHLQYG